MTERRELRPDGMEDSWDFDGTRRHHIRLGLQLTHAERLRWLEETVDEMRQLQGLARQGRKIEEPSTAAPLSMSDALVREDRER